MTRIPLLSLLVACSLSTAWLLQVVDAFVPQSISSPSGRISLLEKGGGGLLGLEQMTSAAISALYMHNNKKKKSSSGGGGGGKGFASAVAGVMSRTDNFPYAGSIRPGVQSPQRVVVDKAIVMPDYALDGRPKKGSSSPLLPWVIEVKTAEEIEKMRAAGKLARDILDMAGRIVAPGVTTDEIDTLVHDAIVAAGAYPSPLNYHGKYNSVLIRDTFQIMNGSDVFCPRFTKYSACCFSFIKKKDSPKAAVRV